MKLLRKIVLVTFFLVALCSCSTKSESSERFCFGTRCSVTIYGRCKNSEKIFESLWTIMGKLESIISCNIENSAVSEINRNESALQDVDCNKDIEKLISTGELFSTLTDGRFSIYIGAVTKLWAIGTENPHVPGEGEIQEALTKKQLDFGAIGKGYASDVARQYLVEQGVESAIINFGGNICCIGNKAGKPFRIGIQTPDKETGSYSKVVEVSDSCVVTSGNYQRYFEENGVRYCHIFDAKTGYPVDNGIRSVTITGPDALTCDALSTCCFILGEEESMILLEKFKEYSVLFL